MYCTNTCVTTSRFKCAVWVRAGTVKRLFCNLCLKEFKNNLKNLSWPLVWKNLNSSVVFPCEHTEAMWKNKWKYTWLFWHSCVCLCWQRVIFRFQCNVLMCVSTGGTSTEMHICQKTTWSNHIYIHGEWRYITANVQLCTYRWIAWQCSFSWKKMIWQPLFSNCNRCRF